MYDIDKQKFGAFVAALRKEKGYTQKHLAAVLYISDKAISKWETGISIPDVSLLIPLSEALGVSVTELLKSQRLPSNTPLDTTQVESLVKTALTYSEEKPVRNRKHLLRYLSCLLIAACETLCLYLLGHTPFSDCFLASLLIGSLVGFYFHIAAKTRLPDYYDANQVTTYGHGPVRLNLGTIPITNRNWPHITATFRIFSQLFLILYPLLTLLMQTFAPQFWLAYEKVFFLFILLGGMLLPVMIAGKKYK